MNPIRCSFVTLWLASVLSTEAALAVNKMCPVLSDRPADADYSTVYKGEEIRFCCNECLQEFRANPEVYESAVPQLRQLTWKQQLSSFLDANTRVTVSAGFVGLLIVLISVRVWWTRRPGRRTADSPLRRLAVAPVPASVPLFGLVAILGYEVVSVRGEMRNVKRADKMHFATFYDFGFPPVPKRFGTQPQLGGTYYRGNDERSPKLFNDGNYRTATFHIELVDGDGNRVEAGDRCMDRELFVRIEIERPPYTPDFLYSDELLSKIFLTRQVDKFLGAKERVVDRVDFVEIEPQQRWEALFRIEPLCGSCCGAEQRGIIYLCEEFWDQDRWYRGRERFGSRYHYGIQYDLESHQGKLSERSEIFMNALYRTRKVPKSKIPMEQWFSNKPIPELPGENVDDPELLGLDRRDQ